MIGLGAVDSPGDVALEHKLLDTRHQGADGAAFFEPLLEVASFVQLSMQP